MKIWRSVLLTALMLWSIVGWSGNDIPAAAQKIIDAVNFPIYPDAVYCTGDPSMGMRLASSDSVEKVREWYRAQFPDWSVYEEYGGWILHPGPADAPMPVVMSGYQVSITQNPALPEWHGLSADMTTEILIALVKHEE
jgi:hypothetical protein